MSIDVTTSNPPLRLRPDVAEALAWNRPVVALESTLIAHGLPRPDNLALARDLEEIVRREGAVPATIGVIAGEPIIGLDAGELERMAGGAEVAKLSVRDLAPAAVKRCDGATTVASTAVLASRAGIRVFATGGLGGVHREARESWDESADLDVLSRTRIGVVCAGVKSLLDIGATLERLETLSVTVVGYQTQRFPGFYLADSGFPLDWTVDTPAEAAAVLHAGTRESAVIFANPVAEEDQLDPELHARVLNDALWQAGEQHLRGKAVTPFLLGYFREHTGGQSLRVNVALVKANARLAAQIAAVR
ncbi:MAG: pseudouridine-5'-phosphate glycosidase [Chloroflexota bacterium]